MRKYQRWINESKGKLTVPDDLHDASLEEKIQQNQVIFIAAEMCEILETRSKAWKSSLCALCMSVYLVSQSCNLVKEKLIEKKNWTRDGSSYNQW